MAQLVAHLHGMQGVRGSSPLSSTREIETARTWKTRLAFGRAGFLLPRTLLEPGLPRAKAFWGFRGRGLARRVSWLSRHVQASPNIAHASPLRLRHPARAQPRSVPCKSFEALSIILNNRDCDGTRLAGLDVGDHSGSSRVRSGDHHAQVAILQLFRFSHAHMISPTSPPRFDPDRVASRIGRRPCLRLLEFWRVRRLPVPGRMGTCG